MTPFILDVFEITSNVQHTHAHEIKKRKIKRNIIKWVTVFEPKKSCILRVQTLLT